MPSLKLKSNHKAITTYYAEINNLAQLRMFGEGAVSPAIAGLLRACANQFQWTLAEQYPLKRDGRTLRVDGALVDAFNLVHGYWEAKDSTDDRPISHPGRHPPRSTTTSWATARRSNGSSTNIRSVPTNTAALSTIPINRTIHRPLCASSVR